MQEQEQLRGQRSPCEEGSRSFKPQQWWFPPIDSDEAFTEGEVMWVYRKTEGGTWMVGFYSPDKQWYVESYHVTADSAAARIRWLNGGN